MDTDVPSRIAEIAIVISLVYLVAFGFIALLFG